MRILMSEWQMQLKFENGGEFGLLCKRRQAVLKSMKNNKGKCSTLEGVESIEIATFGVIKLLNC